MHQLQKAAVIIIGGGPAGLSAAMSLARIQRSAIVLDSEVYRNRNAAQMHNVVGSDNTPPLEYIATGRKQVEAYGTTKFFKHKAEKIEKDSAGDFVVDGRFSARQIVLATGVEDVMPDIPGFADLWGKRIVHCAFCHGYEFKGQRGAVLGYSSVMPSLMFRTLASSLTLLGNDEPLAEPMTTFRDAALTAGYNYAAERVASIELAPEGHLLIHFDSSSNKPPVEVDFITHAPPMRLHSAELAQQLGVKFLPSGEIETTGLFNLTGVKNVYAAGDAMMIAKAVPVALETGCMAAVAASHEAAYEELGLDIKH